MVIRKGDGEARVGGFMAAGEEEGSRRERGRGVACGVRARGLGFRGHGLPHTPANGDMHAARRERAHLQMLTE